MTKNAAAKIENNGLCKSEETGDTDGHARFAFLKGCQQIRQKLLDKRGQGTTEYAILVGALVVIAIIAITVFKPKLQELWNSIAAGINSL